MTSLRIACVLACAVLAAAQTKRPPAQQRDLTIEKIENEAAPPKIPVIPRSYAVIIGISRYKNLGPDYQLQYAERDAELIRSVLISSEGGNFKVENVHTLLGGQATLAAVRREIDVWLPSVAKDDDRVLIYFAGHGFIFDGQGYLAPSDFDKNNVPGTAYPMDELGSVIGGKIRAKSKILLTDACHSGAITPAEDRQNLNQKLTRLNRSLFSLTASRDRESSYESPEYQHGIFTYFVVQGLSGAADVDHDGIVTADELAEYVHTLVREKTQGAPNGPQNPTSEKASFDPDMLLSYVPASVKPGDPPPPKTGTLIFEANMDEVEVFVDGVSRGVISKENKNVTVSGLQPGAHQVKAVRLGYEPDGPRQETVYPGQDSTVTIKILIPARRKKAAIDLLDKGIEYYQKGNEPNYKKAVESLEKALAIEPRYNEAAYYLGLSYNALFDQTKAEQYFKRAIEIAPDYLEAHASYAGMLLDIGGVDEAIRQIDIVLRRQPKHALALTMQAQALRFKGLYDQSISSAQRAIQLSPNHAEPHLWLGDSLRLSDKCTDAKAEYREYLKLSDFDSKLAGQLNYYVIGSLFGMGRRKHASQHDIWNDLRSLAYFGLCDCEKSQKPQLESAINYCQKALMYDSRDAFAHFALGVAFMNKAIRDGNEADFHPAQKHFEQMLEINPELQQAATAKNNLAKIQKYFQGQ